MKRAFVVAIAAGLAWPGPVALPTYAAESAPGAALGRKLDALDGEGTSLAELRGHVVVVNFWASWCAPCRKELRVLESWKDGFEKDGANVLAVSVDRDRRKAEKFVKEMALDLPFYHDGPEGLAKALDLPALPCTVVFDRNGRVAHVAEGGDAETLEEMRRLVDRLSAEVAPAKAATSETPAEDAPALPEDRG